MTNEYLQNMFFSAEIQNLHENLCCGTHQKRIHNIRLHGELTKICLYPSYLELWALNGLFVLQSQYEHHKEVLAAQGVKIIGKDLEKALAGLPMYVAHDEDEVEYYKVSVFVIW